MTRAVARTDFPSADRESFIAAMRCAASTVTIVTTAGNAGRYGLTVSAMSSVSADPPSLLVCVNRASAAAAAIATNGVFCVSLLTERQRAISEIFAGRPPQDRASHLASAAWIRLATGAPVLAGAAAAFDCRLGEQHRFGSHLVLVGIVVAASCGAEPPLIYHDRGYGVVASEAGTREIDETSAAFGALGWGL